MQRTPVIKEKDDRKGKMAKNFNNKCTELLTEKINILILYL